MSLDKSSRWRELAVIPDEVRMGERVAVQEDHVLGFRFGNGLVEDPSAPKALMFLPNMLRRHAAGGGPLPEYLAGCRLGAIIGQQDFFRCRALAGNRLQDSRQVFRLIPGINDEGKAGHPRIRTAPQALGL